MLTDRETFGVNSEVSDVHTAMLHRPDLAHERISPSHFHELLLTHQASVEVVRQPGGR